jgi:hypothetical protein
MRDPNLSRVYFEGSQPIMRVEDMKAGLAFYVDKLGFQNASWADRDAAPRPALRLRNHWKASARTRCLSRKLRLPHHGACHSARPSCPTAHNQTADKPRFVSVHPLGVAVTGAEVSYQGIASAMPQLVQNKCRL